MLVDDPNWPTENDMDDESFLSSRCIYMCSLTPAEAAPPESLLALLVCSVLRAPFFVYLFLPYSNPQLSYLKCNNLHIWYSGFFFLNIVVLHMLPWCLIHVPRENCTTLFTAFL